MSEFGAIVISLVCAIIVFLLALWRPRVGILFGTVLTLASTALFATLLAEKGPPHYAGEFFEVLMIFIGAPLLPTLIVVLLVRLDRRSSQSTNGPAS